MKHLILKYELLFVFVVQVVTLDGRTLLDIPAGASLHSVAPTPGPYNAMAEDGFSSKYCYLYGL